MAMQKTGESESFEVLGGLQADTLNDHLSKTGKRSVSDFSEDERKALETDLEDARKQEGNLNSESGSESQ